MLFIIGFSLPILSHAAQRVRVSSDRAIIYADQELRAPIGTLSRGTELMVSETKRRDGTIVATVVSGKIVWIQVADLRYPGEDSGSEKHFSEERDLDLAFETTIDRLTKNNYLIINYGLTTLEGRWEEFLGEVGSTEANSSMSQLRVFFEHRDPDAKYHWGLGLNYMYTSNNNGQAQYRGIFLETLLSRGIFRTPFLFIELNGGALLSGSTELAINTTDVLYIEKKPTWGYRVGINAKLAPFSQYGLFGGINYEWISSRGYTGIEGIQDQVFDMVPVSGVSAIIGLSYKL